MFCNFSWPSVVEKLAIAKHKIVVFYIPFDFAQYQLIIAKSLKIMKMQRVW